MTSTLLAVAAAFGTGHLQAARAVAEAFRDLDPGAAAEAVTADSRLLGAVSAGYLTLLEQAPAAYRNLYQAPVSNGLRRFVRSALLPVVRRELARTSPTTLIATHPFPAAAAAELRRRGLLETPVGAVVTDFAPHPLWVNEGTDRYFVATPDAAERLCAMGVAPGRISISGIPIRPAFRPRPSGLPHTRTGIRRVLVMGGGLGLGPITEAVRSLAAQPQLNLLVTVVCGRNDSLRQELHDLFGMDPRFTILGYTPLVSQLMAQADLLVTKPGGLTCSEALASHLPMLLLQPLPGHEEENATLLCGLGAAKVADDVWVGRLAAGLLFQDPGPLAHMRERCRMAARTDAAATVAREMMMLAATQQNAIA